MVTDTSILDKIQFTKSPQAETDLKLLNAINSIMYTVLRINCRRGIGS